MTDDPYAFSEDEMIALMLAVRSGQKKQFKKLMKVAGVGTLDHMVRAHIFNWFDGGDYQDLLDTVVDIYYGLAIPMPYPVKGSRDSKLNWIWREMRVDWQDVENCDEYKRLDKRDPKDVWEMVEMWWNWDF